MSACAASVQYHSRRAALDVHEWEGSFRGMPVLFRMTSVIGHVLSLDFPAHLNSWWVGKYHVRAAGDRTCHKQAQSPANTGCRGSVSHQWVVGFIGSDHHMLCATGIRWTRWICLMQKQ